MNFYTRTLPIGVFDSGIGGLTVVKKIDDLLPAENVIYFGDTARVPYGTKSNETVIEYALQDAELLFEKNVKMIVVACNTASSVAIPALKEKYSIPIIGMIEPGTKHALNSTKNGKIGVIGTNATINNKAYSIELLKHDSKIEVFEKACPLFVPLAEEGWVDHKATELIAEEYLLELKEKMIDTLILGCTHYPILANVIQKVMGENVTLIDSGTAAARQIEELLIARGNRNTSVQKGASEFFVSDISTKFKEVAERFLGRPVQRFEKAEADKLRTRS
ncbi:MAG: glutamate racemase [Melioribacteraceae bacterium]|nr:glutamate racemase [Melioribacteraceae bacterium]MCF8263308.1 glutamate racemase [Melioribacteraceae bacterium]MCF8413560.1 glutamate racemase [Melioribacteraceae bacterium]